MARRSALPVLIPTAILDFIGFAIILPIMPLYAEKFGADKWQLMAVMGVYSAVQFIAAPWLGRLSDQVGRKPILIFCYLGSAVSSVLFALAGNIPMILVSRIVNGATGGNLPVAQAVVADSLPPEKRTTGMGLLGMAFGVGFIIGPASGGVMYRLYGPAAPALLAAALSAVSAVLTVFLLPETVQPHGEGPVHRTFSLGLMREAFGYPMLGNLLLISVCAGVAFSSFESTFSQFLKHRFSFGPADVGPMFAAIGLVIAVVQGGLVGRMAGALGERRLVGLGTACMAVALFLIPAPSSVRWLAVVMAVFAFGGGVLNPAIGSLVPSACPAGRIGAMLGVYQATSSLGRIIGPIWGQYARGTFGDGFPYRSAAVIMALAFLIALRGVMARRPALAEAA